MRAHSIAAAFLAITVPCVAALAAPPPSNVLLAGFIEPSFVQAGTIWCMTGSASSTFIRGQSPARTQMSFSEVVYTSTGSVGPVAYRLSGQARVRFDQGSTTKGTIVFDANINDPANIYAPRFAGYFESYNAATHTFDVRFQLLLPSCKLPIVAVYRN